MIKRRHTPLSHYALSLPRNHKGMFVIINFIFINIELYLYSLFHSIKG